jgi:hypothetical protein
MRCLVLLVMLGGCARARVRNDEAAAPNAQQSATPTVDARAAAAVDIRAIPKIDVHSHYRTDNPELVAALGAWNARAVLVDVTGGDRKIDEKWRDFLALRAAHPGRFFLVATFDPFRLEEPGFVPTTIARLREQIAAGAKGVKVWKDIGMELKDAQGRYVQIDDPRFQPIWDFLAEQHVPVLAHIAEPLAAWQPLSAESPHFWYYSNYPQYHAYQHAEIPRHETIIAAGGGGVARHPPRPIGGVGHPPPA